MSEIVFVGTSDAFGAGGRRQSAILLRAPAGGVLIDCGTTTSTGLADLGIERSEVDSIVISHFHGDHYGGIPILLLGALYEDERRHPLRVVGPPGIEHRVRQLAAAMCYAIEDREWSFRIDFAEFQAGQTLDAGPVRVEAFETLHQPHTQPHGVVIDTGAQRVAYSGDTGWFDTLPERVGAADLFICECTYHSNDFEYHLNHELLVANKHRLECGRIILTHFGAEMTDRRGQAAFETADDGLRVKL
jgi:ribonuclease BN (tRNA processing enzyme)